MGSCRALVPWCGGGGVEGGRKLQLQDVVRQDAGLGGLQSLILKACFRNF